VQAIRQGEKATATPRPKVKKVLKRSTVGRGWNASANAMDGCPDARRPLSREPPANRPPGRQQAVGRCSVTPRVHPSVPCQDFASRHAWFAFYLRVLSIRLHLPAICFHPPRTHGPFSHVLYSRHTHVKARMDAQMRAPVPNPCALYALDAFSYCNLVSVIICIMRSLHSSCACFRRPASVLVGVDERRGRHVFVLTAT